MAVNYLETEAQNSDCSSIGGWEDVEYKKLHSDGGTNVVTNFITDGVINPNIDSYAAAAVITTDNLTQPEPTRKHALDLETSAKQEQLETQDKSQPQDRNHITNEATNSPQTQPITPQSESRRRAQLENNFNNLYNRCGTALVDFRIDLVNFIQDGLHYMARTVSDIYDFIVYDNNDANANANT